MRQITPCLWFKDRALEAAKFYISIFPGSKLGTVVRYGKAGAKVSGRPAGSVMTVTFRLNGQEYMGLNGGPIFRFSPATSLIVYCRNQQDVDRYWKRLLSGGGRPSVCGWLTDKFGFSWQITPVQMDEWARRGSAAANERVMAAVLKMKKPDLKTLEAAYRGR